MAGSMLATFIFLMPKRLIPIARINKPPTADISLIASGVSKSLIKLAKRVIDP